MRPIELTVDGFRSYGSTATFRWEDRRLVGVVGPIGSGKSSILDAVAFALYGRVPAFERDVKRLINQRRDECHVGLVFEVDGRRFSAERAMRRKGASGHALYELEGDDRRLVTDKSKEMTSEIDRLLGLDFDGFRRSVLLAQNRFAEFLHATAAQRDAVLEGAFGFEVLGTMRDLAKERLSAAARDIEVVALRRKDLAEDRARLDVLAERHRTESDRVGALADAVKPEADLLERSQLAVAAVERATQDLGKLAALGDQVPTPQHTGPVLEAAGRASASVSAAEDAARTAIGVLEALRKDLDDVLASVGGRDALTEAVALAERLRAAREAVVRQEALVTETSAAHERARESQTTADAARVETVAAADAARAARELAAADRQSAEQRLHEARHASMALSVRAELVVGEACPVCAQTVADLPPPGDDPDIDAAGKQLQSAVDAFMAASAAETDAVARQAHAEASVVAASSGVEQAEEAEARARTELERMTEDVSSIVERLAPAFGSDTPEDTVREVFARVRAADQSVSDAVSASHASTAALDQARSDAVSAAQDLAELVTSLATIRGQLGVDVELAPDPDTVAAALGSLRQAWLDAREGLETQRVTAEATIEALAAERRDLLDGVGLDGDADVASAHAAAEATLAATAREMEGLTERLAELSALEARESETLATHAMLERLVSDLSPTKFLRFVLDEKRRGLAAVGSERLEELSGGRYRFTDDGGFEILDLMAAEASRPAASLSGGETFLASLALALGLAEMVGREGGRLDAFFLDEGFGSLDPEHVDLAMDGIERLVAGATDRLVVVVSHVPALKDRIEDLVVLGKDAVTGDTIVHRGAVPGE